MLDMASFHTVLSTILLSVCCFCCQISAYIQDNSKKTFNTNGLTPTELIPIKDASIALTKRKNCATAEALTSDKYGSFIATENKILNLDILNEQNKPTEVFSTTTDITSIFVTKQYIFACDQSNKLYKYNRNTKQIDTLQLVGNVYTYLLDTKSNHSKKENLLFVTYSDGTISCINTKDMYVVWKQKSISNVKHYELHTVATPEHIFAVLKPNTLSILNKRNGSIMLELPFPNHAYTKLYFNQNKQIIYGASDRSFVILDPKNSYKVLKAMPLIAKKVLFTKQSNTGGSGIVLFIQTAHNIEQIDLSNMVAEKIFGIENDRIHHFALHKYKKLLVVLGDKNTYIIKKGKSKKQQFELYQTQTAEGVFLNENQNQVKLWHAGYLNNSIETYVLPDSTAVKITKS